jgi:hypothetical protein
VGKNLGVFVESGEVALTGLTLHTLASSEGRPPAPMQVVP